MTKIEIILYYTMEGKAVKIPKNPNRRRGDSMARQATKTLFTLALAVMVTLFLNQVISGR
jgi:hypothetical protein